MVQLGTISLKLLTISNNCKVITTRPSYEMHVLQGCAHRAWCAGCGTQCTCTAPRNYNTCHAQDIAALPFVARHLHLDLRGSPSPPLPPPPAPRAPPSPPARGCKATIDHLCPPAVDPRPHQCGNCVEKHAVKVVAAGCTEQSARAICDARKRVQK